MTMRRGATRQAFTLLEILVAITIMGILAASLYASLRTVFTGRDRALAALGPARAAGLAVSLVKGDVESALPPAGVLAGAFTGVDARNDAGRDADSLLFYSVSGMPDGVTPSADVRMIEIAAVFQGEEEEGVLVRRTTRNLLSPVLLTPEEEVLCRRVLSLNLRYYDGSAWQDLWDAAAQNNTLPRAVEMTLELRPEESRARLGAKGTAEGGYRVTTVFALRCVSAQSEGTRVLGLGEAP